MARRPEVSAPAGRRLRTSGAPRAPVQHPSLGRVHLRDRVPPDVARRRTVRHQLHGVADDEFRPDVEGLRALAVIAVVLFHLRLGAFQGGFVGVDVFFVLSGFLITRLLLKELASTGTLSLPGFWARRARRLLPASSLVLVATVLAGTVALSPLAQRTLGVDAMAAGVFVVNFVFAGRFGDYFAAQLAEAQPSALLHYWSLAVEEQFYLAVAAPPRRPHGPPAPVPSAAAHDDLGDRCSVVGGLDLADRAPTDVGVLPPAGADGRAARRCRARRRRANVPRRESRVASRARLVRPPRDRRGRDDVRRGNGVPRLHGDAARALDRCSSSSPAEPEGRRAAPVVVLASSCWPNGSAVTRMRSTCGTGRCSCSSRPSSVRCRCRPASCSSPLPSACRRCRCASWKIQCGTPRGWPAARLAGSPWARRCAPRPCSPARGLRSADVPLDSGEMAAAPTLRCAADRTADDRRRGAVRRSGAAERPDREPRRTAAGRRRGPRRRQPDGARAGPRPDAMCPSNLRPSLRDVGGDRARVYSDDCVAVGRRDPAQPLPLRRRRCVVHGRPLRRLPRRPVVPGVGGDRRGA